MYYNTEEKENIFKLNENASAYSNTEVSINIKIKYSYSNKENNLQIKTFKVSKDNNIYLTDILYELSEKININNYQILYWNEANQVYFNVGSFPIINTDLKIRVDSSPVVIKLRQIIQDNENFNIQRVKERNISDVVKCVFEWRKYYNGYYNSNGIFVKMQLDEAAKKVGISQKSLYDYYCQIKLGKKFGFDFNLHRLSKMGVLRTFIRKYRKCYKK